MGLKFKKHLHLMLCALLSLGVTGSSVASAEAVENIITKKQDDKKEDLHYYSDPMENKDLPATTFLFGLSIGGACIYFPFLLIIGALGNAGTTLNTITNLLGITVATLTRGQWNVTAAGLLSQSQQGVALVAGAVPVLSLIGIYLAVKAVNYVSKQYSVDSPEALKAAAVASRITKGYTHFKDPALQALCQAYSNAKPTEALATAWTFFDFMYSVDTPYFICGQKISFYPGGPREDYYFKNFWETLGYPCTSSTQDMTQEEMNQSNLDYITMSKGTNLRYTGWSKFKDFALLILQDETLKKEEYHKKVTAALKILEWVRNATPQDKPEAITTEAKEIVAEIVNDENIKKYINTQRDMFAEIKQSLDGLDPVFKAYGTGSFEAELKNLGELGNEDKAMLIKQNGYQQKSALAKFSEAASGDINTTGYNGAIMLRKIIASKVSKIQKKNYQSKLLTSYVAFYPTCKLRLLSVSLLDPETPLASLDLKWLNDEKCPDVVRYGLIEMMINNFKATYNEKSVDDLTFADNLAELCVNMLREVLSDGSEVSKALKNPSATEADLNNAVSNALTLPACYDSEAWSSYRSGGDAYKNWQEKYYNEVVNKTAKAVKVVRIISMFFDKLFTANERDRFMGSVGFSGEDKSKRLITLTLWHLKANYPNIVSIKLEEYYKANRRWGDYISGKLSDLGIDMSKS